MAHEIIASIQVTLPDGASEMTGRLGEIAEAWSNMLATLDPFEGVATFSVNDVRKRSDAGRPRARKPRLVPPPQDAA